MKDTDKIEITVGDLKRGAEKCETARAVLKEMFPGAFKEEEWEDITSKTTIQWIPVYGYTFHGPAWDIKVYYLEEELTTIHPGGGISEIENENYRIKRFPGYVVGFPFIRILKRVS